MSRRRIATAVALVALAVVAAAASVAVPVLVVFWALLALNVVLGRRENVPFSTFPMFAHPKSTVWTLRFEDAAGALVPIGGMGLNPVFAKKRFATELQRERDKGSRDPDAARLHAATVIAEQIEQRRPATGPFASAAITILIVEYSVESGRLTQVQTPLIETSPT
jgi:hypothetical protein